ncbi:MAG: hypothetical protein DRJ47_07205 [Thermoprotei archaeon]|nr:MAG: hypothetical protein DRJ47_07205 [Thermoprotei archaeon]
MCRPIFSIILLILTLPYVPQTFSITDNPLSLASSGTGFSQSIVLWVPDNYTSLQEAVNVASKLSNASVTAVIVVRPGKYNEEVFVAGSYMRILASYIFFGEVSGRKPLVTRFMVDSLSNVVIEGFNVTTGIDIHSSHDVVVEDCEVHGGMFGISVFDSYRIKVSRCKVYSQGDRGVNLIRVSECIIENCIVHDRQRGIYLAWSHSNIIVNCTVYGAWIGVWLEFGTTGNLITNCRVYDSEIGIHIKGRSSNNVVENCVVYDNKFSIVLWLNASNNIIRGCELYGRKTDTAISISDYSNNNVIEDCLIHDVKNDGISFFNCTGNRVVNTTIYNCPLFGVNIGVWEKHVVTQGNVIENCTIYNCFRGINLWFDAKNNIIKGCKLYFNKHQGINLEYGADNNIIEYCNIFLNRLGMRINESKGNVIKYNNISRNFEIGVVVEASGNTFYCNNFIENNLSQALGVLPNTWDKGYFFGGNYWSDYKGSDSDGDGIGETLYVISKNNVDHYPLVKPWNQLSSNQDKTYPEVDKTRVRTKAVVFLLFL